MSWQRNHEEEDEERQADGGGWKRRRQASNGRQESYERKKKKERKGGRERGERKRERERERERERQTYFESSCKSQDAAEGNRTRHSVRPPLRPLRPLSRPAPSHLPFFLVNPAWYHVSFPDDGNFLSTARLTYFLPDNGLKFHAIVVTIHSKKLIELDSPEGVAEWSGESRRREDSPRGAKRCSSLSHVGCSCTNEKHAVPVRFLRNLMKRKKGRLLH